jgi:hypothetical protein
MDAFAPRASDGGNTPSALERLLQTTIPFAPGGWLDAVRKAHGRHLDDVERSADYQKNAGENDSRVWRRKLQRELELERQQRTGRKNGRSARKQGDAGRRGSAALRTRRRADQVACR